MYQPYLVIILGLSGAGKSVAISSLEDQGFYYLDNFPAALMNNFLDLIAAAENKYPKVAIALSFDGYAEAIARCRQDYRIVTKVIFLECSELEIITRYKRTRRKHPLQLKNISLLQAIREEQKLARMIKILADDIIDTTSLSDKELRTIILNKHGQLAFKSLQIGFITFGFKYGIPLDADLVLDVRFLINPYYIDELKEKTGLNKEVYSYVINHQNTKEYLKKTITYLDYIFNMYLIEGKSSAIIAVGCTGGKHRSVSIAKHLARHYNKDYQTYVIHREI